jgi:hypothetical protein
MKLPKLILFALFVLNYLSCKKPYYQAITNSNLNYLVVEGNITSGDSTIIKLSRTINIGTQDQLKPELKASITIQSNQNNKYVLTDAGNGNYKIGPVTLDVNQKYSLLIKTIDGTTYQSDYVPMKLTPPIDSVYYKIQNDTVLQFYVNTHDPNNNTHYYHWDYQETWVYESAFMASHQYKNGVISPLNRDSLFYYCYKTTPSTQIFVASTNQLKQDVVNAQSLGAVVPASQKISHAYSMLVNQYAITPEGITYWSTLKKNTEQLGSIFDAVPVSIQGNIHCVTNTQQVVLGFVNASSVAKKRIFINYNDLIYIRAPLYFSPPTLDECGRGISNILLQPTVDFVARANLIISRGNLITGPIVNGLSDTIGYVYAPKECVDCRIKGGANVTNIRPAYFPPPPYR